MTIGKLSVMKNKSTGGMAIELKKSVSYLNNCVSITMTIHINLSAVNTDLGMKIEAHSKDISSLNHKLNDHNGGKVEGNNVGAILPTAIKDKFYGGGDLYKC